MGRRVAIAAAAALLFAIGIVIGSRLGSRPGSAARPSVVTITAPAARSSEPNRPPSAGRTSDQARTPAGAVAAATASVGALDGSVILDAARLRRTLAGVASSGALPGLLRAYGEASFLLRERLGLGTRPEPRVIVRAVPVGYRIDGFTREAATISIWRVGLVGSGATIEPQQSWRTETVSLVWERGGWKVTSLQSTTGPTPPLDAAARDSAAELFAAVPQFAEFTHVLP